MKTLLLLDDSVSALRFTEYYLKGKYRLDGAASVTEALALAKKKKYDMVLVDYFLPEGNGLDLVQALRALADYQTTPIVLVTASLNPKVQRQALLAGVNDCLAKPYGKAEFLALIERMLTQPYRKPIEDAPAAVEVLAWRQENKHYRYCPHFRHLTEGSSAGQATEAMAAFLRQRAVQGEGAWPTVDGVELSMMQPL